MDETTEPVIAVLGHPIAGNPSQFALETALQSLRLDGRVLSFDVAPEDVPDALEGARVLGLRGVLVDAALGGAAKRWCEGRAGALASGGLAPGALASGPTHRDRMRVDCLYREPERPQELTGTHVTQQWLSGAIARHFDLRGRRVEHVLWVGGDPAASPLSGDPALVAAAIARSSGGERLGPDRIQRADLIVLAGGEDPSEHSQPPALHSQRWPADDASTLVVDATAVGHPETLQLRDRGYTVLSLEQRRANVLRECLRIWLGQSVSEEILRDAIEEYLAV